MFLLKPFARYYHDILQGFYESFLNKIQKQDKYLVCTKDSAVINTASVTGPTKEDKLKEYEEKIYTAVRNNDFKEINILAQNKPEVSKEFVNRLDADTNVKPHDKIAVKTILGINVKEELKKTTEKDQEAKVVIEKDNKQQQGKPTGVKRKIAKDIINTGFGDM